MNASVGFHSYSASPMTLPNQPQSSWPWRAFALGVSCPPLSCPLPTKENILPGETTSQGLWTHKMTKHVSSRAWIERPSHWPSFTNAASRPRTARVILYLPGACRHQLCYDTQCCQVFHQRMTCASNQSQWVFDLLIKSVEFVIDLAVYCLFYCFASPYRFLGLFLYAF